MRTATPPRAGRSPCRRTMGTSRRQLLLRVDQPAGEHNKPWPRRRHADASDGTQRFPFTPTEWGSVAERKPVLEQAEPAREKKSSRMPGRWEWMPTD